MFAEIAKKKFDYIVPIGCYCIPAFILQELGLRKFSLPFDWLYIDGYDFFEPAINCIMDEFQNFLKKDELIVPDIPTAASNIPCLDKKTGFIFIHDFSSNIEQLSDYVSVKEKYDRRIKRLLKLLKKGDILFVYFDELSLNDDIFILKMQELSAKFNKANLYLLVLQHKDFLGQFNIKEKRLSDNILKVNFNNSPSFTPFINEPWRRNYNISYMIMKKYCKLKFNFLEFIFSKRKQNKHNVFTLFGIKFKFKNHKSF